MSHRAVFDDSLVQSLSTAQRGAGDKKQCRSTLKNFPTTNLKRIGGHSATKGTLSNMYGV